ncbi:hypothetical protein [Actinacidiphila glaucinigra]|uniref:hypothetical protein n=1 Tax=Actinacidiphila glaucinigra TaxID=235986 RepID=UPI0035D98499
MSTRTPLDVFLSDQALAEAREQAKIPGTLAIAITPAAPGTQCSWCDCDIALNETEHRCKGCPNPAAVIMHQFRHGSPVRVDVPLCTGCHPDAARFVLALAQAGGTR